MAILIFVVWLIVYVWSVGATLASGRHALDFLGDNIEKRIAWETRQYKQNLCFAIGWNLFPFDLIICLFLTGFYEHGWVLGPPSVKDWEKK